MKLVIIKAVASYHQDILNLLKKAKIDTFTGTEVSGYSNSENSSFGWFPGAKEGVDSNMFFAFTSVEQAENLVAIVKEFNKCEVEKNRDFCLKVAVMPVEQFV